MRIRAGLVVVGTLVASTVHAVDGVREINQACAAGSGCFAGDTPSMPVQISAPGAYRLTSNLTPPPDPINPSTTDPNTTILLISAAGVSVDLNGFVILGPKTFPCSVPGTGIGVSSTAPGTVISNGHVRGMGSSGIVANASARVERVILEQNCGDGISVGSSSIVMGIVARVNAGSGIVAGSGSRISDSVADTNSGDGISSPSGGLSISGCTAQSNSASGISVPGSGSVVTDTTALFNLGDGISVGSGSLVLRSTSNSNGVFGLRTSPNSAIGFTTLSGNSHAVGVGFFSVACNIVPGSFGCP